MPYQTLSFLILKRLIIPASLILFFSFPGFAYSSLIPALSPQDSITEQHPAIAGDFADPTILRVNKTYFAAGTSSEWAPYYPLFVSKNLTDWKQKGYIFNKIPSWAKSSFWAPELYFHHNKYLVYYVAKRKTDGVSCIGIGVSDNPEKGFTDKGILLQFGKEAIDPFVFNDNGKLYLSWKAYGLDNRPIELLCAQLSDDGMKVIGKPFSLLRDDERIGMEGQCITKHNNYYYLFYSTGNCCGRGCTYEVRVARATSLMGNYEKLNTPVLADNADWKCTGHGTIVNTPENRSFFMYHAFNKKDNVYTGRQAMLAELFWSKDNNWPYFKTNTLKLKPEGENFKDNFNSKSLANKWQWDLKFPRPQVIKKKSKLYLSEATENRNPVGMALTVRPEKGDYSFTTTIVNKPNEALKGLIIYGDTTNCLGWGVKGNNLQLWEIRGSNFNVLYTQTITDTRRLKLKIDVKDGYLCKFYWSSNNSFQEITLKQKQQFFDASFLPPWDRSVRPGIMQKGSPNDQAIFSKFMIDYH